MSALLLGASGCTGTHESGARPVVSTTIPTGARRHAAACDAVSPATRVRRLGSRSGSVWVWIESAARPSFRVGSLVKIVWRITGQGAPRAVLAGPGGGPKHLTFGPERHPHSTFRHPGAEYGTGFTPTTPGCWTLTMRRGDVSGALSFEILQ